MSSSVNKVRLTKWQRGEMSFLVSVMEEGFDDNGDVMEGYIAQGYGFDRAEELTDLDKKLRFKRQAGSLEVELNIREARTIWHEFDNRLDIELSNSCSSNDEHGRAYRKLKDGMARLEAVFGSDVRKKQ
ncbi:hypothetical protein [Xanthomonas phage X1]|nr:hypothetical protein [Xanthomonas phage X1]